jgi:hypothetical protein
MSSLEIVALLALTGWAVYRQTVVSTVTAGNRFTLAIVYAAIGLLVGGVALPRGTDGWALVLGGVLLSGVVGVLRGRLTRIWLDERGTVLRQGTVVTVGLFLGLIVVKVGLGVCADLAHVDGGEGFGETLVMIAVMIAVQAEIVQRRALALQSAARQLAASL